MPYLNDSMLPEIDDLTVNDKERLISAIHWAIAEEEKTLSISLDSFRSGTELLIGNYDFREVYDRISKR